MDASSIYKRIIRESFLAMGYSSPNPPVASVLYDPSNGEILTSAHTQVIGSNHSEREAYTLVSHANLPGRHDLYVSLEPCTHFGRTPPCRDLILEKKPNHVYVGHRDPHPLVLENQNQGEEIYRRQGILIRYDEGLANISRSFLTGFFSRVKKKRPKILFKTAVTSELFYARQDRQRTSISCPESNYYLQFLRAKTDAILVGPATIESDLPSLSFRIPERKQFPSEKNILRNSELGYDSARNWNSYFWEALWELSLDEGVYDFHNKENAIYQPLRCFVLGTESYHRTLRFEEFLKKQSQPSHSKPAIFFLLEKKTEYSPSFLDSLPGEIRFLDRIHPWEDLLVQLGAEGVNHLMVEGGNFLYQNLFPYLDDDDEVLLVRNSGLSWGEGVKPWHWNILGEKNPVWKGKISQDEWMVFSPREASCSQD